MFTPTSSCVGLPPQKGAQLEALKLELDFALFWCRAICPFAEIEQQEGWLLNLFIQAVQQAMLCSSRGNSRELEQLLFDCESAASNEQQNMT